MWYSVFFIAWQLVIWQQSAEAKMNKYSSSLAFAI